LDDLVFLPNPIVKVHKIQSIFIPLFLFHNSMCLAVPGKILSIGENAVANVDFGGVERPVNVSLVDVAVGDFVIVHAGYAIQVLSEEEAMQSLDLFRQILEEQNA
jgi:hydrogenase expression/formation protein HypC